jgi:hypothetical protein
MKEWGDYLTKKKKKDFDLKNRPKVHMFTCTQPAILPLMYG